LLGTIYRTLEGWRFLLLPIFIFTFSSVEVWQEHIFHSNQKWGREGGDLRELVVISLIFNGKMDSVAHMCCSYCHLSSLFFLSWSRATSQKFLSFCFWLPRSMSLFTSPTRKIFFNRVCLGHSFGRLCLYWFSFQSELRLHAPKPLSAYVLLLVMIFFPWLPS
jgi:hypothetical protein